LLANWLLVCGMDEAVKNAKKLDPVL